MENAVASNNARSIGIYRQPISVYFALVHKMLIPLILYGLHCIVIMLKEAVDLICHGSYQSAHETYLATSRPP